MWVQALVVCGLRPEALCTSTQVCGSVLVRERMHAVQTAPAPSIRNGIFGVLALARSAFTFAGNLCRQSGKYTSFLT